MNDRQDRLSESELLLLTNYEYFNSSVNSGTIKDNIAKLKDEKGNYDIQKIREEGVIGEIISEEDALDILDRLEKNEKLNGLHMARNIDRGGIRATLYTDEKDKNPTLVFRGTGGTYKAWKDNVLGEYQTDTRLQRMAADFVKYECADYSDITTTGHSKGSNLAQYVTVVCGSQIDRCVGYDGQGFSRNFHKEYKKEIATAKNKITAISGFNDFVNILLTPIAGEILYVKNQEGLSADMHSCYTLLSNGSFDNEGDFKRDFGVVPQLPAMTLAKWASDGVVSIIDSLPEDGDEKASKVMAAWVASIFSADMGKEYEQEEIKKAINEFKDYSGQLLSLTDQSEINVRCSSDFLNMYVNKVKDTYLLFDGALEKLRVYPEQVEDLLVSLDYNILGRSFTENALKKIIARLDKNIDMLDCLRGALLEIIRRYENTDKLLA